MFTRSVVVGIALVALAAGPAQAGRGVGERAAAGPPRGGGGHTGAGARVRGRPVLRERLAHHGRDGRDRHPAAEAARQRLPRRQRPVGRSRHEVHERVGLRPLRPAVDRRPPARAHRRRPRRAARRPDRPEADQPLAAREDRQGHGRRPFRADDAVPMGLRRHGPQRERQRAGPRRLPPALASCSAIPGGCRARRAITPTPRSSAPTATRSAARRARPLRPVRPGPPLRRRADARADAQPVRRRPVRQGTGGRLRYKVKVRGGRSTTLWVAVAGSENSAGKRAASSAA